MLYKYYKNNFKPSDCCLPQTPKQVSSTITAYILIDRTESPKLDVDAF